MSFDLFNFDYPPPGSRFTMIVFGILIPGVIGYFAFDVWVDQGIYWPSRRLYDLTIQGDAARACAVVFMSIGTFIHFRRFWGLRQHDRVYQIGARFRYPGFSVAWRMRFLP